MNWKYTKSIACFVAGGVIIRWLFYSDRQHDPLMHLVFGIVILLPIGVIADTIAHWRRRRAEACNARVRVQ
jgi:hypothetical protein